MYCLKCGCETTGSNIFCDDCLAEMKECPVKGDVAIHIPDHPMPDQEKKAKKQRSADSLVKTQKNLIRILFVTLILLLAIVCVLSYFLMQELQTPSIAPELGNNYPITAMIQKY